MYLANLTLENIRSIEHFEMKWSKKTAPGWHVLIGDNGAGKSTVARAIALAMVGPSQSQALLLDWNDWLRKGEKKGQIRLNLPHHSALDKATGSGSKTKKFNVPAGIMFDRLSDGATVRMRAMTFKKFSPERYLWGDGAGWFCASYGPYRRFAGGDPRYEKIFYSHPRLARHLTVFGEDVALTEALAWLQQLHVKNLEKRPEGALLPPLIEFVNTSGLLPHDTHVDEVRSDVVFFRDGNGCTVKAEELSDGYRSILSLTFELLRQLAQCYGTDVVLQQLQSSKPGIQLPGVVVIDEIDAHLHPSWQGRIGPWFLKHFPRLQFIVTTHSPIVCRGAERGSVWRLAAPGSTEQTGQVTGTELQRLLHGSILEALDTDLFGRNVTRSASSQDKLERLAQLNIKAMTSELSAKESQEREDLQRILPTGLAAGYDLGADEP